MHPSRQRSTVPTVRRVALVAAAVAMTALVAAGCSSSPKVVGAGRDAASASTSTTATTLAGPTTTAAGTTLPDATTTTVVASTVAPSTLPPTTTPPATLPPTTVPMGPVVLRGDGLGSFAFGTPYGVVASGLSTQLAVESDVAVEFPVASEYGFESADASRVFTSPYARLACWADGGGDHVCASFGGADPAGLRLVGWSYTGRTLRSTLGVTNGSLWSEFPAMLEVGAAGCYSETSGSIEGIFLVLESSGAPFSSYDDLGNIVPSYPDPTGVSVRWMEAGDNPHDLEGDC